MEIDAGHIHLVVRMAEAEIDDLHRRVIARRPEVLEACRRARRAVRRPELPVAALAVAGAVALATGLEARRRRRQAVRPVPPDESTPEVSVRIPVTLQMQRSRVPVHGILDILSPSL